MFLCITLYFFILYICSAYNQDSFVECKKCGKYPLGVGYDKGKYHAALNVDGKTVKLGIYNTPR